MIFFKKPIFFLIVIILISTGEMLIATEPEAPLVNPTTETKKPLETEEQTISLKLKNMDIIEVFNILSQKGNLNIIAGNEVRGRVTLFLEEVDVWEAFLQIIETNNLAFIKDGNIIRVFTDREHEVLFGEKFYNKTETQVIALQHVQASAILPTVEGLKSRVGKVVVDENSNSLILIDTQSSIDTMTQTILQLDVPLSSQSYQLEFITASELSEKIKPLLSKRGNIYMDMKTNTLIITDVETTLNLIKPIVDEYNKPPYIETALFQLQYAKFDEIKEKIEKELTKDIGSVQIDKRTGYIVINDLPSNIERLKPIITALDEKHLEVLIDVQICAIRLSDQYTFGINWEYALTRFQHNNLGFNFGSMLANIAENPVSNTPIRPFDSRSTKLDGNDVSAVGPGGHVVFAGKMEGGKDGTGNPYQGILEMIRTLGDVDIISSPRIAVINGEEAKIQVGVNEAYVTNTVVQSSSTSSNAENVNFIEVGVNLQVTPHINKKGFITMEIEPEVSNVARFLQTASGNRIPIVRTTNAKTNIMVEDGATIVLAGFIEKTYSKEHRKIPFFGSIPIVNLLFKRVEDSWTNQEIVIVITPKIIAGNEYANEIDRIEKKFENPKKFKFPLFDDFDRLDMFNDQTGYDKSEKEIK